VISPIRFFAAFLFTLLLALSQTETTEATRIVFDDIGYLASAVSYAHVVIPIHVKSTVQSILNTRSMLQTRFEQLQQAVVPQSSAIQHANYRARRGVVLRQIVAMDHLVDRLKTLQPYFPFEFTDIQLPSPLPDHVRDVRDIGPGTFRHRRQRRHRQRQQRFAPFAVLGVVKAATTIFSTINGLYTRDQLKQLKHDLKGLIAEQRRVVTLVNNNTLAIQTLDSKLSNIQDDVVSVLEKNPALDVVEIDTIIDNLHRSVDLIIQTVQQAQQNRLAIEFLTPQVLQDTFNDVKEAAVANQATLMIEQAADLAQVAVSYISDKDGTVVILHVPMIPAVALLRLMRLRPFPIPLDDETTLIPEVDRDVMGISNSDQTLSAEIRYSDLLDCHKIGQTYFCERQGVLSRNADTCLTALHYQQLEQAMKLCELRITNATEAALQMADNRYLIYSPRRATAPRVCTTVLMGASVDIPKGISYLDLKPGCYVDLPGHRLYADASVRTANNQFSYLWDWDGPVQTLSMDPRSLSTFIHDLRNVSGPLRLQDVIAHASDAQHRPYLDHLRRNLTSVSTQLDDSIQTTSYKWIIFTIILSLLLAFLLITALLVFIFGYRLRSRFGRFSQVFRQLMKRLSALKISAPSSGSLYPNLDSFTPNIQALSDFAAANTTRIVYHANDSGINLTP